MILRHPNRILVPEEVRCVQHGDVERVALDPLAAVEESSEIAQGAVDPDAQGVLDRMHRAHLVGDRTDAADACGDVRGLLGRTAAEERLEEARRLEYLEDELPPRGRRSP